MLAAIENPDRPIIDRLVAAGFGPTGGRDLRAEALTSGAGYRACAVDPECLVYGRGAGMRRHEAEAHS